MDPHLGSSQARIYKPERHIDLLQLVFPLTHFVLGGSFISIKTRKQKVVKWNHLHYNGQLADFILAMRLTIKHLLNPKLMEIDFLFCPFGIWFCSCESVCVIFLHLSTSQMQNVVLQIQNRASQSSAVHISLSWALSMLIQCLFKADLSNHQT